MTLFRCRQICWLIVLLGGVRSPAADAPPFVMLVSIDGLKPEAVLARDHQDLKLPNLRALVRDGVSATGVQGVLPTLTYPSHMTLMTGASPAKHGIYANTTFDPLDRNARGWYWYAEDKQVETLWDAATAAHLTTANVYWPTSVGAQVTFNLPQIWRSGTEDDLKLQRALSTPGLEQELSQTLGPYPGGEEETIAEDETRAAFAVRLTALKRPNFITVYLTGLDTEQHKTGPFSPAANSVLERIDVLVGELRSAAEAAAPGRATFCVVSDHGFARVDHDLNLYSAFLDAGLFTIDQDRKISAWKAIPWPAGGSAAIMLADPKDAQVKAQVADLLKKLAANPQNGIERVMSQDEAVASRGFPQAAFVVLLQAGFEIGLRLESPLVGTPSNRGMHGFSPLRPDMHSSFFLVGPRVAKGRSLGQIDMRQIAPTIARRLGLSLKDAELVALKVD